MAAQAGKEDELVPDLCIKEASFKEETAQAKRIHKSVEHDIEDDDDSESSKDDSESGLSDLEYVCKVCSKKFSGFIPLKQHEKSGKHGKVILKKKKEEKLKKKLVTTESVLDESEDYLFFIKKPYAVCQTCGKHFPGPESYDQHLESKYHKLKILEKSFLDKVRESGEITNESLQKFIKDKVSAIKSEAIGDETSSFYHEVLDGLQKSFPEENLDKNDLKDDISEEYECKTCEKVFSGFVPFAQHIISKVHAKTLKRKAEIDKMKNKSLDSAPSASTSNVIQDLSALEIDSDVITCSLCTMSFSGPENAIAHLKSKGHTKKVKAKMWRLSRKHSCKSFSSDTGSEDSVSSRKGSLQMDKDLKAEGNVGMSENISEAKMSNLSKQCKTSSQAENNPLENIGLVQLERVDGNVVVDAAQNSVEKDKEGVLSYDKYKQYKEIMNNSDDVFLES